MYVLKTFIFIWRKNRGNNVPSGNYNYFDYMYYMYILYLTYTCTGTVLLHDHMMLMLLFGLLL